MIPADLEVAISKKKEEMIKLEWTKDCYVMKQSNVAKNSISYLTIIIIY
jgi:hypothetical protein